MSRAQDALAEADSEIAIFEPEHRGLQNLRKLPLQPPTFVELDAETGLVEHRLALLATFKTAAEALLADGHPGLPKRVIDPAALADLNQQIAFENDAMTMFMASAATAIGLVAGSAAPKV